MSRKVRFHNIMQSQRLPLKLVWVHFSWADFYRDDCFKGISRIITRGFPELFHKSCSFLLPSPASPAEYIYFIGHHFKLIFCMHHAQIKTINQVLDYFLTLTSALKTNAVTNIRFDSCGWRSDIVI